MSDTTLPMSFQDAARTITYAISTWFVAAGHAHNRRKADPGRPHYGRATIWFYGDGSAEMPVGVAYRVFINWAEEIRLYLTHSRTERQTV